jgi:hypothetical protein
MAENEAIANIKDIIEKAIISKDKEIKKEELRPLYRKLKDLYQSRLLIIYFLDDISAITAKWKIKSFNDTFLQFLMVFN